MSSKCLSPIYDLYTFGFTDVGASFSKTRSCFSPTTPKFPTQGLISIRRDCALRATPKPFGLFSSVKAQKFRFSRAYHRYGGKLKTISPYISRYRLTYFRVLIEVQWLMRLSQIPEITEVPNFSEDAQSFLQGIIGRFSTSDALEIMDIEEKTNEGVEAVEYFLKQKCRSHPEIAKVVDFFYFPCASDINNLAYTLMLGNALYAEVFPTINALIEAVCYMSKRSSSIPMLSRTHGQTATATAATTLGKEMANFAVRLNIQKRAISQVEIMVRFADTAGNYNAHIVAYPSINWPQFAEEFVTSLGVGFNPYGTQLETDHYMPKILDAVIGFNSILTEFCEYLCGYFGLTTNAGEVVGKYTIPHEDFSDSKIYLRSARLHLSHFKLTDSGVLEDMGAGLENSIIAYTYAASGIKRIWFRVAETSEELNQSWEVLAEAIQTVMGRYGVNEPYEMLKELTSGLICCAEALNNQIYEVLPKYKNDKQNRKSTRQKDLRGSP